MCPMKPLGSKTRKLIAEAIERMNYSSNNHTNDLSPLLDKIDTMIDELKDLRYGLVKMTEID